MAYDGLITSFLGQGLAADRPAAPTIHPSAIGLYYATDTKVLSRWAGGAWSAGLQKESLEIAVTDETSDLAIGMAMVTFRMPYPFLLVEVRASVSAAPIGAAIVTDLLEGGVSVFSTTLSIDDGEKTSVTAATPAVISDANLADDAEMEIDINQVGSTTPGAGLKMTLIGFQL